VATTFDEWLRHLRTAKQGPVSINIDRGVPFAWSFAIKVAMPASTVRASLRFDPDSDGVPLIDFTVTDPEIVTVPEGTFTIFRLSLNEMQTSSLPFDDDGNGLVHLAFDTLLAPDGADFTRIFAGAATISGKVTNAI
jgi:hypothetical protein